MSAARTRSTAGVTPDAAVAAANAADAADAADVLPEATAEWLEADGLGGFASGTVGGMRTRRYHGLLLVATTPPTGRMLLVAGLEAWVETPAGSYALSSQHYAPGVVHPDGARRLVAFASEPWPRWTWRLEDGTVIVHELLARRGAPVTLMAWRATREGGRPHAGPVRLSVRPLMAGRDPHALHGENGAFRFDADVAGDRVRVSPYEGVPSTVVRSNGAWGADPQWYRRFLYTEEAERGLDCVEDLASPGTWTFELSAGEACLLMTAEGAGLPPHPLTESMPAAALLSELRELERARREALGDPLLRAADSYLVRRGTGRTLVAGYPWFTDWGRDTFLALRGLCLATGRLDDARSILVEWAGAVSQGMLPNRFPDRGESPEFNSVDASLWYVVAVGEYLDAADAAGTPPTDDERSRLNAAVAALLDGYARGTRYGIAMDTDGLLRAGAPGWQLTWMDARVGDREITPRIGKPVEIQALWANALAVGARCHPRWATVLEQVKASFAARFWNAESGALHDVVDVDHVPGRVDPTLRPNQVLAVGGLPLALLDGPRARSVVDVVEARLLTPLGLRTLPPGHPEYRPIYRGGPGERDGAYHQGTVWPWLLGPFVEAWVAVRGGTAAARRAARERFLPPLQAHLRTAGLGHVSEIVDAEAPHAARGCPFQAWSLGELLRLQRGVLAPDARGAARRAGGKGAYASGSTASAKAAPTRAARRTAESLP